MLCLEFRKAAVRTWSDLILAAALKTRLAEESITDYLVFQLAKGQVLGSYQVQSFTKKQESLNGADWEIWLTGPTGTWFGLRLQAKVMSTGINRYKQLHKPKANAGSPSASQRLINSANAVSALPIYLLYSAWTPTPKAPAWACGTYPQDDRLWGLSFVEASKVKQISPKTTLQALSPYMQTAHCMFCCGAFGGADLPTKAHAFALSRFSQSHPELLNTPPQHLLRLLGRPAEGAEVADITWPDRNLGRITVIQQCRSDGAAGEFECADH